MINLDYEAWRCSEPEWQSKYCPDEGCTLKEGCARKRGWLSDQEKKEAMTAASTTKSRI